MDRIKVRMGILDLKRRVKEQTISPEDFLTELWKFSEGHIRKARRYAAGDLVLYRTRTFTKPTTPVNVADLSYPPASVCRLNRANSEGDQVFYASAGLPTTLGESRVNEGEYIIVSKWKNTQEIILQEVGLSQDSTGIEKLYHDIFTESEESIYPYSAQVAEHLMKFEPPFGLLYPSIINQNHSHNVALKKETVDERLEFINASLYEVGHITDDSKFEVTEFDFASAAGDGKLEWRGRRKQWTVVPKGELQFVSNGWDWEAFLPDGTYLEPN